MTADRNAPCPCGSGRKSKRCCAATLQPVPAGRSRLGRMNEEVRDALIRHARRHAPLLLDEVLETAPLDLEDDAVAGFWTEWVLHHLPMPERSIAAAVLASTGRGVHPEWLEARLAAPLSTWEVVELRPGEGLLIEDLLRGDQRFVHDVLASTSLRPRHVVLASVAEFEGGSHFAIFHPLALPPRGGADAVRSLRRHLGVRGTRKVTTARLRRCETALALMGIWSEAVVALRAAPLPRLTNTDGDPLLLTVDHFDVVDGAADDVLEALGALDGAIGAAPEKGDLGVTFTRPGNAMQPHWSNTVMGHAVMSADGRRLRAETNSIARANRLRAVVESACGTLVRHRAREHSDPASLLERRAGQERDDAPRPESGVPPEIAAGILREMKARHYASWPDHPLPALGGRTPREAASGTPALRRQLDLLLKDFEAQEFGSPPDQRFDVASLRESLGMASVRPRSSRPD